MKRFLICFTAALLLAAGCVWLFFCQGFYLDLRPGAPVQAPFRTLEKTIQVQQPTGAYQTLELRGVDVTASLPGTYASDFAPEPEDYLRWLEAIGGMGANLVRVYTLMDRDFYDALYQYNQSAPEPLYLLQGIEVPDAVNNGRVTAYDQSFLGSLLQDGRDAVDIIHGRKLLYANGPEGGGWYGKDLSPWVLGYIVGHEWNADTIVYTDHNTYRPPAYQGEYFCITEDATHFEAMLAQVMDAITAYESGKYKTQRLIGFNSGQNIDFLEYETVYARQLNKYAQLDPEHILPQDALRSGYFAAYRLYDFCEDFSAYLSAAQRRALSPLLADMDSGRAYGGYLDLLGAYHTMPVLAAGYGFSTARGAVSQDAPPLTEIQQGQRLMAVWQDARAAGWAGVCISAWQDAWERRSWNTAFATELSQSYLWHDLQTDGEHYGLLAFEPGESPVCVLDGDWGEWEGDEPVLEADGMTLWVRYDQEGLYLLLRGQGITPQTPVYLPLDLNQALGSRVCADPQLTFDREADLLLCLDGTENTRLLVQARYDALRENFHRELGRGDPFLSWPEKDSPAFVPIGMAVNRNTLVGDPDAWTAAELEQLQALGVWPTGQMRHGNGDPEARDYDSLADFCFGEGCVELRLPWLLLNVADPTGMRIHQDYYEHYGVETRSVRTLWLGLGTGAHSIPLVPLDTASWDWDVTWRERRKQSYDVIQSQWKD